MILSSGRRGTLYGRRNALKSRLRSNTRLLATESTPSSASGTPPFPPPPSKVKKRGLFSRLFWYSSFLTAGFYTGSTAVALYSDEYRTFFIEHVPLGERIIDFTDSQGWDRAPVKAKSSQPLNGLTMTDRKTTGASIKSKVTKKIDAAQSDSSHKTPKIKNAASQKIQDTTKYASDSYRDAKEKTEEAGDKLVESVEGTINEKTETRKVSKSARGRGIKFSDGVEEIVQKAEEALKLAEIAPTSSVLPLDESNVAEPGPTSGVDILEEIKEEVLPSNVYSGRLPIGFEPPPGYVLPRRGKAIYKKAAKIMPPPHSPLLAPQVGPFISSEPILGQLASTIDALTRLIESTPSAPTNATLQLERAKIDLANLAQRVDSIKAEERAALEKELNEQTQAYNKKLHELERQAQEKFDNQEKGWRSSFNEEQRKLTENYKKKLESELETLSELINRRLEEEVISQGVNLQRRWIRDLKVKIEEEREGRLSRLEELASSLKKLERLTIDNANYLEQNLLLHALWSSLRSLTKVLDSSVRTPFRKEVEILRNITHNHCDDVVESVLLSLDTTSSPDIGVEPFADLASWFNTSVAPSLVSVALVPDSAGVLSHLAAHVLSNLQFRRHGLVEGDDVLSVVARAEYYLNEKDLDSATRELNQLQGPSRALLKDWLDAARRRLEVQQALQVIEARATISSLLLL